MTTCRGEGTYDQHAQKNVENSIKTFIDHLYRDRRFREDRLVLTFIEKYLERNSNLTSINNPAHYVEFCFDLFSENQVAVTRVKQASTTEEHVVHKRFDRLVEQLERFMPSYSAALAGELLGIENGLCAEYEEMGETGMDVARHFLLSSSFGVKGKLLFNVVRFMRPATCVEIGTAYGMSSVFILQALESFSENGRLWTIEAADTQFKLSSAMLNERSGKPVTCLNGYSTDCLPRVISESDVIDFYFHDGGHYYDNIVNNFEQVKPHLRKGSIVLIDDIRWWDKRLVKTDPRCHEAWRVIVDDPSISNAFEVNGALGVALVG